MQRLSPLNLGEASGITVDEWGVVEVDYDLTVEDILNSRVYSRYHAGFDQLARMDGFQTPKRGRISVRVSSFNVVATRRFTADIFTDLQKVGRPVDLWTLHAVCGAHARAHLPTGALALGSTVSVSNQWTPCVKPMAGGARSMWLVQGFSFEAGIRILYEPKV